MEGVLKKFNVLFENYKKQTKSSTTYEVMKINIAKPLYESHQEDNNEREDAKAHLNDKLNIFRKWI
jgi:hypothetical protein